MRYLLFFRIRRDKMKKEGVVLTKKVEQLFRQVEAEKNPVMILYVFK